MNLGIDLGTSGVKLLLLDDAQQTIATADAPLQLQRPQPLWSEQHPADWWAALEQAVAVLRQQVPAAWARVRRIGLSGQMHGAVLLDATENVLRPAMLWNDGRSAAECVELERSEPRTRQITGNQAMPGFTAPKLLWLRQHEPDTFKRTARVLLPKDWLRLQLTGEAVSEMSDASGTQWLDVGQRRWSAAMLAACGLDLSHMPLLVEGSAVSGTLLPALVQAWGWTGAVLVAGGGGDNAASAIGVGAFQAGQGFVSLGTSGVIFRVSEGFQPAPAVGVHAFAHALPGQWHQMAVMLSAASAFQWFAHLAGAGNEAGLSNAVADLGAERRAQAPIFLPYLSGERTPHNDPQLCASWTGLRATHGAPDLAYAVMEGVSFGLLDGWRAMGQSGPSTQALALVGGGARSDAWAQLLASALQCPLRRSRQAPVAAALGAARLAWLAGGGELAQLAFLDNQLGDDRPGGDGLADQADLFLPDAAQTVFLLRRHARFQHLFSALATVPADGLAVSGQGAA